MPRFDAPSVFAAILDDEKGGHFRLKPLNYACSQQLYLPDINVLLTRFLSSEGVAEVLDFMPVLEKPGDRQRLVRGVRIVRDTVTMTVECEPAFDYARQGHGVCVGK